MKLKQLLKPWITTMCKTEGNINGKVAIINISMEILNNFISSIFGTLKLLKILDKYKYINTYMYI